MKIGIRLIVTVTKIYIGGRLKYCKIRYNREFPAGQSVFLDLKAMGVLYLRSLVERLES